MKGTLIKKSSGWFVQYVLQSGRVDIVDFSGKEETVKGEEFTIQWKELPLHPESSLRYLADKYYAIAGKEVEFEIVREGEKSNTKLTKDTYLFVTKYYAKIIQPKQEDSWGDIFDDITDNSGVYNTVTPGGAFFKIKKYLSENYLPPKKK